jgi:hypothetical protein
LPTDSDLAHGTQPPIHGHLKAGQRSGRLNRRNAANDGGKSRSRRECQRRARERVWSTLNPQLSLDLENYPHLPIAQVATTAATDYLALLSEEAG